MLDYQCVTSVPVAPSRPLGSHGTVQRPELMCPDSHVSVPPPWAVMARSRIRTECVTAVVAGANLLI